MEGIFFEGVNREMPPLGNKSEVAFVNPKIAAAQENLTVNPDLKKIEAEKTEFLLMQQIDAKVGENNIGEKNYLMFGESLIKEFGVEKNDKIKAYIFAVTGIRAQIEREKQIYNGKDGCIAEKIEYKQNIGNFITEWRKNPKVIKGFWQDVQKEYESFQKSYPDAWEQTFKGFKYGILAELAAKDASGVALEKLNKPKFGIKKYEIKNASIKADGSKATDFFITFTYLNNRVEKIPCQVKAFDIRIGSEIMRQEKINFCEEKMINLINSNRAKDRTQNFYYTKISENASQKTEKLRTDGFSWAESHDGMTFFIPADQEILQDNGLLSAEYEKIFEEKFIEQYDKYFPSI